MKYKKKLQKLKARQAAWERLGARYQNSHKKPGGIK
jgi:hypothetical protein